MAEERRPSRGNRDQQRSGGRGGRDQGPGGRATGRSTGRGGQDRRSDARGGEGRTGRAGGGQGRTAPGRSGDQRGRGPRRDYDQRPGTPAERTEAQKIYDGPELPEDVTGAELDRSIAAQLKSLPDKLAHRVARHLSAAGLMVDEDPETAYRHTLAAKARAPRIAVVREAVGEAAYAAGHYAEALAELRAAKRMNGATAYLPIMADCHRALGQPDQALKLAKNPSVAKFSAEAKAEMTIVEAGARRDLGQFDAALRTLELAPLNSKARGSWVLRLRYAYADTLAAAGRRNDALAWFHRTHAIDADEITDAAARADELERLIEAGD